MYFDQFLPDPFTSQAVALMWIVSLNWVSVTIRKKFPRFYVNTKQDIIYSNTVW